jgi:hypothetical protein
MVLAACGPQSSREAGGLELRLVGIPAEVEMVRFTVSGPEVDTYEIELGVTEDELTHVIESVPAGDIRVFVVATAQGAVTSSAEQSATVVADVLNRVTFDLDPDRPPVLSGPLVFSGSAVRAVGVPQFELDVAVAGPSWTSFLQSAESEFGRMPEALELRAARVASVISEEAETLDDAWGASVSLRLVGADDMTALEVGRIASVEDTTQADFALTVPATMLDPLMPDLLASEAAARLSGASAPDEEESFRVDVDLTLEWAAR